MTNYENSLFTVRFVGPDLETVGVSIYDLGLTLVSLQRLIHKAYLEKTEKQRPGAFPTKNVRHELSLQIGERKRQSDAFGLIPIVTNPQVIQTLTYCAEAVFNGVVGYYTGDVIKKIRNENDDSKKIYIGSIYSEVVNIVSRIDTESPIHGIELNTPLLSNSRALLFDEKHKESIVALKHEFFLGAAQEVIGDVFKLYPNSSIVSIRISKRGKCNVYLQPHMFEKIRYAEPSQKKIKFVGRPRYALGVETKTVKDFEAYSFDFINT